MFLSRAFRRYRLLFVSSGVALFILILLAFLKYEQELNDRDCIALFLFPCPVSTTSLFDVPVEDVEHPHKAQIEYINNSYQGKEGSTLRKAHKYYEKVLKAVVGAKPNCEKLNKYLEGNAPTKGMDFQQTTDEFSEKHLSKFLQVDIFELQQMIDSHRLVMENLPDEYPEGIYKGNGIAYVGGGKYSWMALLSIKNLREIGCALPVEVFVPNLDDFELDICTKTLPSLNAKCVHIPTALFAKDLEFANNTKILGYQYKSLAILLSSFENVLLLDSDNIPVNVSEDIFLEEPFKSRGLVVWPDFWQRTTSPHFFTIAGREVSKSKTLPTYKLGPGDYIDHDEKEEIDWAKIPLHERFGAIPNPSSESGQLMISKRTHMKAILLAVYYNMYGPGYYYPLFSQGTAGQGDKETFIAATVVLDMPFYQVLQTVLALGHLRDGKFRGTSMAQHDPLRDYLWNEEKKKLREQFLGEEYKKEADKLERPHMAFLHANFPKLDPFSLFKDHVILDDKGTRYRMFGNGMKLRAGRDVEQDLWGYMQNFLCETKLKVNLFRDKDVPKLCDQIKEHLSWLNSTEE